MKNNLFILLFIFLISSCSSKRDVLYFQDLVPKDEFKLKYEEYKLKTDDILKIDISSENPEALRGLISSSLTANANYTKDGIIYNGYRVDNQGNIYFPTIGKITVIGKTTTMVRNEIYNFLTQAGILLNPSVDVKIVNASFTVLGEVNLPGRHEFNKNNLNILEALGIAGDLTINGERSGITLLRESENKIISTTYDLTDTSILSNENFQIFPGDIIIVNPNNTRVKNAGIIGNSGTLLSLLSFILSSIIVINN